MISKVNYCFRSNSIRSENYQQLKSRRSSTNSAGNMVETKGFDSQDGIALQWLHWKGIKTGLISGRNSPATTERAKQCKFEYVYQGHIEKIPILMEILAAAGLEKHQVAYIGDDLTDIVVMHRVGLAIATGNARVEVKQEAHYVTHAVGGSGAVREVVEMLLKAQGSWDEILEKYEIPSVHGHRIGFGY